MNEKIVGLYPCSKSMQEVEIFGYSSRGIPGIEVNGFGCFNKIFKEKIIFSLKNRKIKLPLKRFVLSTTIPIQIIKKHHEDYTWLELPAFIIILKLLDSIPIRNLDNCFCSGKVNLNGKINIFDYKNINTSNLANTKKTFLVDKKNSPNFNKFILIEDLLN